MAKKGSDDVTPLKAALEAAASRSPGGVKPPSFADDNRSDKKNYAQYFSNELALLLASRLRPHYKKARVTPKEDGTGQEFSVGAKIDSKKTDVGVWDDAAGLILGVSIKTYSFRDFHGVKAGKPAHLGRYVRNVKRNDMELRDEADVLHRRQPYAVLFGLFFLPRDATWDGINGHSSFAHVVFTLRKRTGRISADATRPDQFEKIYIGLFTDDGAVQFFDVENAPPENQPPQDVLTFEQLIDVMQSEVVVRNEGVSFAERYAPPDSSWSPPSTLPEGLESEPTLVFEDAIEGSIGPDTEDDSA